MMCPPESVNTYGTPSRRNARATTRPPCIDISAISDSRETRDSVRRRIRVAERGAPPSAASEPARVTPASRPDAPCGRSEGERGCPALRDPSTDARPSRPELDLADVGDTLPHELGELLLDTCLDLTDPLARDAEVVADLLQRHRLLVAHERLET